MTQPRSRLLVGSLLSDEYLMVMQHCRSVDGHGLDAGFARVEHVEYIAEAAAGELFYSDGLWYEPVTIAWCHGVPGPVLLNAWDVRLLYDTNPRRVAADRAQPWWPLNQGRLFAVAEGEETVPDWKRRRDLPQEELGALRWADPRRPPRAQRRAATFTKPGDALLVGDYLQVIATRWPETDLGIDEGFVRVEHFRVLDPEVTDRVFLDAAWRGQRVVVVDCYGVYGRLLLRADQSVTVLADPNVERAISERRDPWSFEPSPPHFHNVRQRTLDEERHAEAADRLARPDVDDSSLYPSWYDDELDRRMALESRRGFRPVPLSALPWPHWQDDCPLWDVIKPEIPAHPTHAAAHAAAYLRVYGKQGRDPASVSCPYHQAPWPKLVNMLLSTIGEGTDDRPEFTNHPDYAALTEAEKAWLVSLVTDPIYCDDYQEQLSNGQHRLCALRAAGLEVAPVRGSYLPDTEYGQPIPAVLDAQATIQRCWEQHLDDLGLPSRLGAVAARLPRPIRTLFLRMTRLPEP